jgi:threonine synthase
MAVAVDDREIISSMKRFFEMGIYACPEAASTLAALDKLKDEGVFNPGERTLLYLTGNAMKYFDVMEIDRDEIPVLSGETESLA